MNELQKKGWIVALAGTGINLALGVNHAWSVFKEAILVSIKAQDGHFTWDISSLNSPYSVCCLTIAFAMIAAGRLQDKFGPRPIAIIGGIFTGIGLIVSASSSSLVAWILGFGVLTGTGLAFGFAAATPPAMKWFPASKTGFITGIVVGGFGLAPAYIAPLAQFLIGRFNLSTSMVIFGFIFSIVVCSLAWLLVNPPNEYKPVEKPSTHKNVQDCQNDFLPSEMLKTGVFYMLWIMFGISAGAPLMIVGNLVGMAKQSLGDLAWFAITLMAFGNASGRFLAGFISDKLGRVNTMLFMMLTGVVVMFSLFIFGEASTFLVVLAAFMAGFNYGTNLSLFPAASRDYFGLKNFGVNYGVLITGWGVGVFVLTNISQVIMANTGSYKIAYLVAGCLLTISAGMTRLIKAPQQKQLVSNKV